MDENKKYKLLSIILIAFIIILLVLYYIIFRQIQEARELTEQNQSVSPTITVTQTAQNVDVSYNLGSPTAEDDLDSAKDIANRLMLARENRSLEQAKPYMTDDLYNSTSQDEFAGISSPSMDRFEVVSAELVGENTYEVNVKSYWLLQGEEAGEVDYKLTIQKQDENFLVSAFEQRNSSMQ